jgi:hypothetical protein
MDIVSLGATRVLESSQWRLQVNGLSREISFFLSFSDSHLDSNSNQLEGDLGWIIRDSSNPLEMIFDLSRIGDIEAFSFGIKSDGDTNLVWTLEALNSNESLSAGGQELRSGDSGDLIIFEQVGGEWTVSAQAPKSTARPQARAAGGSVGQQARQTKVLIDASPSALEKLQLAAVLQILSKLNLSLTQVFGSPLRVSYLGAFETQLSGEQQLEHQHKNALERITQLTERPDPLRRVVANEVETAARGSRLIVISDGSFLVSTELAELAEGKDVLVDLVVVGNPVVIAPLRESTSFTMTLVPERMSDDDLDKLIG